MSNTQLPAELPADWKHKIEKGAEFFANLEIGDWGKLTPDQVSEWEQTKENWEAGAKEYATTAYQAQRDSASLQAKCEKYEALLRSSRIALQLKGYDGVLIKRINEALSGEGENGADLFKFTEWAHENAVAQYEGGKLHSWRIFGPNADGKDYTTAQLWDKYQKEDKQ